MNIGRELQREGAIYILMKQPIQVLVGWAEFSLIFLYLIFWLIRLQILNTLLLILLQLGTTCSQTPHVGVCVQFADDFALHSTTQIASLAEQSSVASPQIIESE